MEPSSQIHSLAKPGYSRFAGLSPWRKLFLLIFQQRPC